MNHEEIGDSWAARIHTARVWDVHTGSPIGVPMRATNAIRYVKFSPDGSKVVTGTADSVAEILDLKTGSILPISIMHRNSTPEQESLSAHLCSNASIP